MRNLRGTAIVAALLAFSMAAAPSARANPEMAYYGPEPELLSEWIKAIDLVSDKNSKTLFWAALWWSNTPTGREYLESKMNNVAVEDERIYLKEMLSEDPLYLDAIVPESPQLNDLLWGAFLASGNQVYVVNLITAACRYNNRDDLTEFVTAGTAKWSLASNAQVHEIVLETLEQERLTREGEERLIISDIIEKSMIPGGPGLILEEAEAVVSQQRSEGNWMDSP